MADQEKTLSRKLVAVRLGVSVWTVDRWRKLGKMPEPIIATHRGPRWTDEQIRRWLSNRVASRSTE